MVERRLTDTETAEPVRRLLDIGQIDSVSLRNWIDYPAAYGLTGEHVDALVRMMLDPTLLEEPGDVGRQFAPVHAWRALGQLRDTRAVAPLLELLARNDDDDLLATDLPEVFRLIGPSAMPALGDFLAHPPSTETMPIAVATDVARDMGKHHPACRDACIAGLVSVLQGDQEEWNGFALAALLDLKAAEAIDAIRAAFTRGVVDASIAGDLEDAEIAFGLRKRRSTPRPRFHRLVPSSPRRPAAGAESRDWAPPPRSDLASTPAWAPVRVQKIGRNDPCSCGSGKKFKKCCGSGT